MQQLTRSRISIWTILVGIAFVTLLFSIPAYCQTTTVSATVVDQASTVWANGTWKLDFVPNPSYNTNNVVCNGVSFPSTQWTINGTLDGSGHFSQAGVKSNDFCNPSGSTWTLTVCPNATSACSVLTRLTITGSTLNLSSQITAVTPAPNVLPLPVGRAYNDAEVHVTPSQTGYFYQNVTTNQPFFWGQDQAWHPFVPTGVESFTVGNLNPLFFTTVGADPANPDLQFHLENISPALVWGNCTTGTTTPTFCALTAAMIPSLPYVPSGTSFFYQTVEANGTSLTQRPILNFSADFTTTDSASPARTNVAPVNVGTAGTHTCPTQVVVDSKGRTTSVTDGTCPSTTFRIITDQQPGCSTPTGTGQFCGTNFSWSPSLPDTNYSASCTGEAPFTSGSSTEPNALDMTGYENKAVNGLTCITTSKGSAGPASFTTIDLIVIHQ